MLSRHKRLIRVGLVILAFVAFLAVGVVAVVSAWSAHRLDSALSDWRGAPSDQTAQKVIHLLESRRFGPSGSRALQEIISPRLHLRSNYVAGRRVFASLQSESTINPRHLLNQYLIRVSVGDQIVYQSEAQGSLKKGVIANLHLTNGFQAGRIASLGRPGDYRAVVTFHVKFLPRPKRAWRWPSSRPWPWKVVPERIGGPTGKPLSSPPLYECKFILPADIKVVQREDIQPVHFISSPDLDLRVKEAFRFDADSSQGIFRPSTTPAGIPMRNAFAIHYGPLPANLGVRTKFRERNGKEHSGSKLGSLKRAGESGVISTVELYYDLLSSLQPAHYEGEIILETDKEVAYEFPGITSLWSGTLTFPVSFFIDPPKGTASR